MILPKPQLQQSLKLKDYTVRIIVAGSRGYNDRNTFHEYIVEYLNRFDIPVLFISGAALSGADRLIIQWCEKYKYPCKQYPANWDKNGKAAGFIRNEEMSEIATHLLCFYNGISPGSKNMIALANDKKLTSTVIAITV